MRYITYHLSTFTRFRPLLTVHKEPHETTVEFTGFGLWCVVSFTRRNHKNETEPTVCGSVRS